MLSRGIAIVLTVALAGCAGSDEDEAAAINTTWSGSGGGGSGGSDGDCVAAEGPGADGTDRWESPPYEATVTIDDRASCQRRYTLSSTAPLRDGQPENPRTVVEDAAAPVLRSGHDVFDALYALALAEVREASVDAITDGSFNGGQPLPCPSGGCFETGRLWTYVWTRDTSYAVGLGLGLYDPTRARNSLELKQSERRQGGDRQIVQDTGTGGSYPISSDRVVWALGAMKLLEALAGAERDAFRDLAWEAIRNTAEHDRAVVWDAADGLYRGETSFLDWREQTYAGWTADDPVQIGATKALGTNVLHLELLRAAAALATELRLDAEATKYQGWADALATAIGARFWLPVEGWLAATTSTPLDPAPAHRRDLLASALAIVAGVTDASQAASVVASYPHTEMGPPVVWPQQQLTPIYHNRAIWPFATAYWLRAARRAGNAAVVDHAVRSLVRGAALDLSNMENLEMESGLAWVDDGPYSGPVVDSQRQLWSVAGYLAMVNEGIFGIETGPDGIRFQPFLPRALRTTLFAGAETIALSRFPWKGKRFGVVLELGPAGDTTTGALVADGLTIDGSTVTNGAWLGPDDIADGAVVRITLVPASAADDTIAMADTADWQALYGPRTPAITGITLVNDRLVLGVDLGGENPADVTLDVYRDGTRIGQGLPGATASFTDVTSGGHAQKSYCYSLETAFGSGNRSQRAKPVCWWGPSNERIQSVDAQAFQAVGGTLVLNHGKWHYEGWGDPSHTITAPITAAYGGKHFLQLVAGNGSGPIDTGITCAVKLVEVKDGSTLVGSAYLVMPQLGSWDVWRESSLLELDLEAGKTYTVTIREDERAVNMSELQHFAIYGGTGGAGGRVNRVNIAEIKLLATDLP
jgi:hypothetical protein